MGRNQFQPLRSVDVIGELSEDIDLVDKTQTDNVVAGNIETVNFRAPTGYLYEILSARLSTGAPSGATSGAHQITASNETIDVIIIEGESNYGTGIDYQNYWKQADSRQEPTTEIAQLMAMRGLRIDETDGLELNYSNATDADQTAYRKYLFWVRKIKVA